jgi:hypothetical protein
MWCERMVTCEGTESVVPMLIVAIVLWLIVGATFINIQRRK